MGKLRRQPKDPRGAHLRIYWNLMDSPAWLALGFADRCVYVEMRRQLRSFNNGDISAPLSYMKTRGIQSSATLSAALRRLEALGLIKKTRQGGIAQGSRTCTLYRFTDEQTVDHPKLGVIAASPTNEWRLFKDLASAQAAIEPWRTPKKSSKNQKQL